MDIPDTDSSSTDTPETTSWVSVVPYELRWKWQICLPNGICWVSRIHYANSDLAAQHGKRWLAYEVAYRAMSGWLAEMTRFGVIDSREQVRLTASFIQCTHHEPLHSA
jgi:hypothetical protein